ncbi:sigma-70 family RNA polymerase sigma factor [Dactylosporangium sp. CA-092794]|uniref:sigma-70 family RNA polymerase sigma factor n=1 Tax=Dactylosporangium sp. CA-092794 TaxID=3239929 RepID=UPI003D914579
MEPTVDPASAGQPGAARLDEALRQLYDVYSPMLLSYLMRLTNGDRHRAEDIVQETLIRAWNHPEARLPDGYWSRRWLFTVARRIAIDHIRAVSARPPEHPDERIEAYSGHEDDVERMLDRREVREALARMPERLRSVLVAMYFQDFSTAEAAQLLSVPQGTVKSRMYHAMRALREDLVERGFNFSRLKLAAEPDQPVADAGKKAPRARKAAKESKR